MKRVFVTSMFLVLAIVLVSGIAPYIRVAEHDGPLDEVVGKVKTVLEESGYDILGQYQPGDNPELYVVVFTSEDLIVLCQQSEDRGMLAAAMKVGFQETGGKIAVSILNPEYLFFAYFRELMNEPQFNTTALKLASDVKGALSGVGSMQEPFGGDLSEKELIKYRYMAGMPNFGKSVSLAEVDSFSQGVEAIRKGLTNKGDIELVYEIVDDKKEVAVFGIGLKNKEEGEAHFLPIIGENHVAAMPYEIILQGNSVTMLHGRYRFALNWPELTMKTFTKIMSSPGDVEDAMQRIFESD